MSLYSSQIQLTLEDAKHPTELGFHREMLLMQPPPKKQSTLTYISTLTYLSFDVQGSYLSIIISDKPCLATKLQMGLGPSSNFLHSSLTRPKQSSCLNHHCCLFGLNSKIKLKKIRDFKSNFSTSHLTVGDPL